jgi:hypothetical protein
MTSKLNKMSDCIRQDQIDFETIHRWIARFRETNDQFYLDQIENSCNTSIEEIKMILSELEQNG